MAYQIQIETSNGYRCSCCRSSWDSSEWVDTLEDALEQVPVELQDGEPLPFNGDFEIIRVSVMDGSTGEEVAWGKATWSSGPDRSSVYQFTRWAGFRPDIGAFETVYDSSMTRIDRSWKEIVEEMKELTRKRELAKAQRDLDDAKARVKRYSE